MNQPSTHRAGFVALCGRPNVGKSTLLNALMGEHLAVATRLPQTTRQRMLAVWSRPEWQAVLVDTPGIHRAKSALNRYMVDEAIRGARDVDLILLLADAPRLETPEQISQWSPGPGAQAALESVLDLGPPVALVLTKCDLLGHPDLVLPLIERWQTIHEFAAIVPTSAVKERGLEALESVVVEHLPEGPALYDTEQLTDRDMRWHVAELVRGELFRRLSDELPYSTTVTVESYREGRERDRIRATIHVERESQKGIVIGARARTVRAVSMAARERIETLAGRPCDLFLEVKVSDGWTKDPRKLEHLGYTEQEGS